jgi:hypothetical protein
MVLAGRAAEGDRMITAPRHVRPKVALRGDPRGAAIDPRCAIGLAGLGVVVLFLAAI